MTFDSNLESSVSDGSLHPYYRHSCFLSSFHSGAVPGVGPLYGKFNFHQLFRIIEV